MAHLPVRRKNYYRDNYRMMVRALYGMLILALLLICLIIIVLLTKQETVYYTTNAIGVVSPLHNLENSPTPSKAA